MTKKRFTPGPQPRTTLSLTGTHKQQRFGLDYWSVLGLEYAGIWLVAAGSLTPPEGGIVRRALQVYLRHLAEADPQAEAIAVRHACKAQEVTLEEQRLAQMRMYSNPLPVFADVIRSPARAAEAEAFSARFEALLGQVEADAFERRSRGGKASAAKHALNRATTANVAGTTGRQL